MVCKYDGFELVEERWISYSGNVLGNCCIEEGSKSGKWWRVGEGRGGEVLIPFHARTEKFTCIAV